VAKRHLDDLAADFRRGRRSGRWIDRLVVGGIDLHPQSILRARDIEREEGALHDVHDRSASQLEHAGQCGAGQLCLSGGCTTGNCRAAADCAGGQVCNTNSCGACASDAACVSAYGANHLCQGASCVDGGALFAPKYVENKLKFFPYIKEAVAFGDRREKVCVFVNIDLEAVGNWAEKRNLPYGGYTELSQKPEVSALIRECVQKVNADLAADEKLAGSQISRFLILHKELDADDGELTRTRKVRRGAIGDKYSTLVDALYDGRSSVHVEAQVKYEDGRTGMLSADLKVCEVKTFPVAAVRKAA
jgi:hypothetical protein